LEYGNRTDGAYDYYSSSGGEGKQNFFELKEAYVTLEKLDFLPKDSSVWAGRKFYGRDSAALTGEFWKQSSGVGFGYETNKFSMALVGADLVKAPDNSDANGNDSGKEQTAFVLDTRIKNIKVPGGNVELQVNLYTQKNAKTADELNNSKSADSGLGLGITYNIDGYYGVKKGWSKAGLAYGKGLGGSAKGLNFGSWLGDDVEDSKSILATTYGMVNLTDKLQVGTEVTLHNAEKVFGADDINRFGITVNPSYKITKNLRMTAEAAFTTETYKNSGADLDNATTSLTLAPVITIIMIFMEDLK
jgi:sucrose porin